MSKCSYRSCNVEFGILNHKYQCSGCGQYFCDEHACKHEYIAHFHACGFESIDKAVEEAGYLCRDCFEEEFSENNHHYFTNGIFNRVCERGGCRKELNSIFVAKIPCKVCGRMFCSDHISEEKDVDNRWLASNVVYPKGEGVCQDCLESIDIEKFDNNHIYHEKAHSLRLVAGNRNGKRKAILVHGILSGHESFDVIGTELVRCGAFDVVWTLDDIIYQGRVNEATRLKLAGFITVPNPMLILAQLGFNIAITSFKKAIEAIDLPPYIIEGTARNLATTIKLLGWKNVTIIGHSLGGIVSRCAVETYDLSDCVQKLVTLGSPHRLWLKINNPKYWDPEIIRKEIEYLVLVGKNDWVVPHRSLGDLTSDDEAHDNILKIIIEGADHTSIHSNVAHNNVANIVRLFVENACFDVEDKRVCYHKQGEKRIISTNDKILGMKAKDLPIGLWHEPYLI